MTKENGTSITRERIGSRDITQEDGYHQLVYLTEGTQYKSQNQGEQRVAKTDR